TPLLRPLPPGAAHPRGPAPGRGRAGRPGPAASRHPPGLPGTGCRGRLRLPLTAVSAGPADPPGIGAWAAIRPQGAIPTVPGMCWPRSDRGGSLIEYAAVLLLVCAIAAAVVMVALPRPVADGLARAVCLALQLDDCEASTEVADADYEPERCLQTRMTDVSGYQVEVVVTFGEEFSFITESFSDGETRVTLVDTAKLEASLGAGASLNITRAFQLGAEISVGGGLSVPNGSTWVFDSPEEAEQ